MMIVRTSFALLFVGFLLLTLPGSGRAAPAVSKDTLARANRHIKYAERYLENKEYDQAIDEYRQVNTWVPQPRIDYFLGKAYRLKGDQAKAKGYFERYLQTEPSGEYAAEARAVVGGGAGPIKDAQAGLPLESSQPVAKAASQDKTLLEERGHGKESAVATASVQAPAKAVASTAPAVRETTSSPRRSEPVTSVPAQALSPPGPAVLEQPAAATKATTVAAQPPAHKAIYRRWWLWTIVGSVAVHGGVGAALGITASPAFRSTLPDVGSQSLVRF